MSTSTCKIRVPTSWCDRVTLSARQRASEYVWLNDPSNDDREPRLKTRWVYQPVFGSTAEGALVLRVGYFARQANAAVGCPSKLTFDPDFKKYIADKAARFGIFKGATTPPALVFLEFTLTIGVPTEYGRDIYANVATRVTSFLKNWGREGVSPHPKAVGPSGRNVGWTTVVNEAAVLLASEGAFDTPFPASWFTNANGPDPPVSGHRPLSPPVTPVHHSFSAAPALGGAVGVPLDGHEQRLDNHEVRINTCEDNIEIHADRLNTHEDRLGTCENNVNVHEDRLNTHQDHIVKHAGQIKKLNASSEKVSKFWEARKKDLAAQAKRNSKHDEQINGLGTSSKKLFTGLKSVKDDVASHDKRISRTEKSVDALKTGHKEMSSSIADLASSKSGVASSKDKKRLDTVIAQTASHSTRLSTAEAAIQAAVDRTASHGKKFKDLNASVSKLRKDNDEAMPAMSSRIEHSNADINTLKKISLGQEKKINDISQYLEDVRTNAGKGLDGKVSKKELKVLERYVEALKVDAAKGLEAKAGKDEMLVLARGVGELATRLGIDWGQRGFMKGKGAKVESEPESE